MSQMRQITMELHDRLNILLGLLNLNPNKFSKICGLHQSTFNDAVNGKRMISGESLIKISAAFPQVNLDWLLTGHGEVFKAASQDSRAATDPGSLVLVDRAALESLLSTAIEQGEATAAQLRSFAAKVLPGSAINNRKKRNAQLAD